MEGNYGASSEDVFMLDIRGTDQDVVFQDVSWGPPLVLFSSGRVRNGAQGEDLSREQRLGKHGLQQLVWLGTFLRLWSSFCSYLEPSEMVPAADDIQTSELLSDEGEMWGRSVVDILSATMETGGGRDLLTSEGL